MGGRCNERECYYDYYDCYDDDGDDDDDDDYYSYCYRSATAISTTTTMEVSAVRATCFVQRLRFWPRQASRN